MSASHSPHGSHTVLVVDDDAGVVKSLETILAQDGFAVIGASAAEEALALVAQVVPCMVLTDVMMPGVDGFELCKRLKQDPRFQHVPVALMTAKTQAEDVKKGIEVGAVDYIRKPFDQAELRLRLRTQILLHAALLERSRVDKHLVAISSTSNDAIIVVDELGLVSHWNEAAERMFGYPRDEALGRHLHQLIVPERFRVGQEQAFERFRRSGSGSATGRTLELTAVKKTGLEFPVELSLSAANIDNKWCAVGIVRDVSGQKAMLAALRKSEADYCALFESSHDALATIAPPDWRFNSCNQAFLRLFGVNTKAQALNIGPTELSPELQPDGTQSSERMLQLVDKTLREGSITFNWMHRRLNGEPFLCEVCLTRVGEGETQLLQGTLRDITESVRQADALRASEARYRASFEDASVGQAHTDARAVILDVNIALARMLGYDVCELRGKSFVDITHPDDLEQSRQNLQRLRSGERICRMEKRYLTKSGEIIWADFNMAAIRDSLGNITQYVAYIIDITERKRAEQAAAAGAEFLNTLLNAIPVPVFYMDAEGRCGGANRAMSEFFGKREGDLVGQSVYDLYPPQQAALCRSIDSAVLTTHGSKVYSGRLVNGRGIQRDVLFHKATFTERNRSSQGLIGVILDVTEHHRVEEELQQARKLESVGQLAAGIAHEINTPAQYVSDGIYFLRDVFESCKKLMEVYRQTFERCQRGEPIDEHLARLHAMEEDIDFTYIEANVPGCFERCIDGISRISSIVRAMKEFSHPDQREKSLGDINQALRSTLTIARNEYKYVADIETELAPLPPILCHLGDLNQVFLNLIVNSAHAIEAVVGNGGAKGKISIRTSADDNFVRIDISDTGAGIPDAIRERIFDPFFTTKEVGKGSGQGLAIARSIVVDKHGGTLTFDSKLGSGTTFTIRLPLQPVEPASRRSLS